MEMRDTNCDSIDLAAYLDGELTGDAVSLVETHIIDCAICHDELNAQKEFLLLLNGGLSGESQIEIPAEFTESVVARAENTFAGLRRPNEQFNAIFIIAALAIFTLFTLGAGSSNVLQNINEVIGQAGTVAEFALKIIYSFLLSFVVLIRSAFGIVPAAGSATVTLAVVILIAFMAYWLKYVFQVLIRRT